MTATYWQRGETIDYTNETDEAIEAGTVLDLNGMVGIAGEEIAAGATAPGGVHIEGVYKFTKADSEEIALGAEVYFADDAATATAGDVRLGRAVAAAAPDDTEVLVKINVA